MKILLSNDDGADSPGLFSLVKALSKEHIVIVAAPSVQQSGMSHALTVRGDMDISRVAALEAAGAKKALRIHGTPTDCVKLYLEAISPDDKPDLVISGINFGANLGTDVLYSGTVGAALEGYMHAISSLAVSLDYQAKISYDTVAELLKNHLPTLFAEEKQPFFLNVNFPVEFSDTTPKFVWTALGHRDYLNAFTRYEENGRIYFRLAGEIMDGENDETTDIYACRHGYIAITPLTDDMADHTALKRHGLKPIPRRPLFQTSAVYGDV